MDKYCWQWSHIRRHFLTYGEFIWNYQRFFKIHFPIIRIFHIIYFSRINNFCIIFYSFEHNLIIGSWLGLIGQIHRSKVFIFYLNARCISERDCTEFYLPVSFGGTSRLASWSWVPRPNRSGRNSWHLSKSTGWWRAQIQSPGWQLLDCRNL